MPKFLRPHTLRLVLALGLAAGLAGCETFDKINPFGEKETPLPGSRQPVFPNGVPGVTYSQPLGQPTNSNIPLDAAGATAGTSASGARPASGN